MSGTVVIALGGNVLTGEGEAGTIEEQRANARRMARAVAGVIRAGWRTVLTHGNGPQVGNLAIQQEEGARMVPPLPLHVLVAMTQGQIGHVLGGAIADATGEPVAVVVTHVEVDRDDPAFAAPSKPIGPFFDPPTARRLARRRGWVVREDAGRGMRRVVPSPEPRAIVEADAIAELVDRGFTVIAAGGGGIPVVRRGRRLEGVDAVIDKDLAAERLASAIGADTLLLLTGVDHVALDFGTPRERPLGEVTADELRRHLDDGQFPAGSMGPKVLAAIRFVEGGGRRAIITSTRRALAALAGTHGTRVVRRAAARVAEAP
ncbi:MAG TPA: carbamate kinase [Actinomycetota bacterium]|nr:carbamate kinase [Actinomycetota bacterium]